MKKKMKVMVNKYNILIGLLTIVTIIFLIMIINLINMNSDVNNKIDKLDSVVNEILVLKDNYDILSEIDKKIEDISKKNDLINVEINNLTNSIKSLDMKIAKYQK